MAPSSSKPNQPQNKQNSNFGITKFEGRTKTLKKKAWELASLCDIPICMICYGPNGKLRTWPESKPDVEAIVTRYKNFEGIDRGNKNPNINNSLESKKSNNEGDKKKKKKIEDLEPKKDEKTTTRVEDFEKLLMSWEERLYELQNGFTVSLSGCLESKSSELKEKIIELLKEKKSNNEYCIEEGSGSSNNSFVLDGFPVPDEQFVQVSVRDPPDSFWPHMPLLPKKKRQFRD